jgi:hypothetical protein
VSELVLTHQSSPGALGANLSAFFFTAAGLPSYVGNDGIVYTLTGVDGNGGFSFNGPFFAGGNFTVASNMSAPVGNVTLNNVSRGRVIVANGSTSVVVTSNRVNSSSVVLAVAAADDSTGWVKSVVAANGLFTVNCNAPSANMPVNFFIVS